jgi:hypothetical protein
LLQNIVFREFAAVSESINELPFIIAKYRDLLEV